MSANDAERIKRLTAAVDHANDRLHEAVADAVNRGMSVNSAAHHAGVHRTTIFRWIREIEQRQRRPDRTD